jgi:hypothetical protein
MSSSFTRKKREATGSIRKSITNRQTGTLLETIKKGVKSFITKKDYADYIEKLEKWKLTNPTQEECNSTDFMENAEGAFNFTGNLAITEKKNREIPIYEDVPLPRTGCKEVVFGLSKDLYRYFEHNTIADRPYGDFIILAVENWSEYINKLFLSCAIQNKLNDKCGLPIRILIPKEAKMLTRRQNETTMPRITNYEFKMFYDALFKQNWDRSMHHKFIQTDENFTYDILLLNTKGSSSGGKSKKYRSKKHRSKKYRSKKHKKHYR